MCHTPNTHVEVTPALQKPASYHLYVIGNNNQHFSTMP